MGCGASAKAPTSVVEAPEEVDGAWKPPEETPAFTPGPTSTPSKASEPDGRVSEKGGGKGSHHKKTPCKHFQKGHCKFGDRCKYSHDITGGDRRSTGPDEKEGPAKEGPPSHSDRRRASAPVEEPLPDIDYEGAVNLLQETVDSIKKSVGLRDGCKELIPEVQEMDQEERTASMGVRWQFGGRRRGQGFHDYEEKDSSKIEAAYQAWLEKGKPKKHGERRIDLEIQAGDKTHKASVDLHLMTQKAMHKGGAVRSVRRFVLPSRAEEVCSEYFDDVISLVGDVAGNLEQVNGRKAGMGLTTDQAKELTDLEMACVDALRPIVNGFIELAVLCNAGEILEKLTAVLGPKKFRPPWRGGKRAAHEIAGGFEGCTASLRVPFLFKQKEC